ncbi:RNA 2'-phosphotransferase [Archaeoglobales archaeon]|nr:MAG: RNA 2'-phosphotransferase [Archaeoglobales archaeon]
MVRDLGVCETCGEFEGSCECGRGEIIIDGWRREKVSKFLSGLLRHFGYKFGIDIDDNGWADLDKIERIVSKKFGVGTDAIRLIVKFDRKERFEIKNSKIRAKYGHSIDVNVNWSENGKIPDKLYHGTHPKNVRSILKDGLKPIRRKEVHLSSTIEDAIEVGKRYAKNPAILEVDTKSLAKDGFEIRKKGKVYTTDFVPPKFIKLNNLNKKFINSTFDFWN